MQIFCVLWFCPVIKSTHSFLPVSTFVLHDFLDHDNCDVKSNTGYRGEEQKCKKNLEMSLTKIVVLSWNRHSEALL